MKRFKRVLSVMLVLCMLLSCMPAMSAAAAGTSGTTAISDLEVDQRTTPMGIDNTAPEFRWEMTSDVRGQKQTAYRIIVKDGDTTVWDTGKVESDISNAIAYAGTALESSTRYTWTVTVWDKDGNELPSQESWFETGLLDQSADWAGASFIAPSSGEEDVASATQYIIDFDFIINKDNQGLCFGMKDSSTFVMWQVSSYEGPSGGQGDIILLRPHFKSNGSWTAYPGGPGNVKAVDITEAIGYKASEIEGKQIHERIVVNGANIKTYFGGADATAATPVEDLKLADDYTHSETVPFNGLGFRQSNDGDGHSQEICSYDNIVVKDFSGNVLYSNDFSDASKPGFALASSKGAIGVENGWLKVGTSEAVSEQIYVQKNEDTSGTSAPMFRKDFTVKEGLVSARLYATSLGIYEAYINGAKVGDQKMAPGWTNYCDYIQYQTYDVTGMLKTGENAVGAIVGNGWYSGHVSTGGGVNKYGVDEAFIGKLVLTYADGTTETVCTDSTWQAYTDGPYVDTCNQNGETYDARKEVPGWANAGFDASGWMGTKIATKDTINTKVDTTTVELVAQPEEPARVIEELSVKFLAKTGDDTYVYDVGQNISGIVRINVKGDAGTTVKIRHGEMVYKDTNALYTANLREAKATDYYTLKGTESGETYEPAFTFHGFRYIEISGLGYQPDESDITALVVHSELDRTGWVTTNNELVNQLFSNVVWGQRDNYLSIPTDCPQRDERLGWTGDATTFSRTGSMNFDIDAFYTKFMRNVENARNKSTGAIYDIAPREGHAVGEGNHGWGDVAIVAPWTMYTAYADTGILEENWTMMTEWIKYYVNKAGSDLLVPADSYGDWLAVESSPKDVTATAYFAYSTSLMAKMATALGKTDEATYYSNLFEQIRTAFVGAYVNQSTGVITGNTQTVYAMALYFDLISDSALRQKVADNLVARIEAADWHLTTGFLGCELLLPALTEAGYTEIAYQLLLNTTYPSWLYPVVNGATTIWERWNSYIAETGTFGDVSMNSFNHYSYGSVAEWFYQYAAGIQYDWENPGYKHFTIAPNPSKQLNEFKAEYESVYGRIVSDWTLDGETYSLNVTVPANTTATVVIPSDVAADLTVDGKAVSETVEGVTYVGTEDGKATFEVASGSYAFVSTISTKVSVSASSDDTITGKTLATMKINGTESSYISVEKGTEVTVEAIPANSEWAFVSWTGDVESTDNPVTVQADSDLELVATYQYVGLNNLAEGKSVTASSNDGGAPSWSASNLTDGLYMHTSTKNGWTSAKVNKDSCDVNVQIDLGAVNTISEVHLYPRTDSLTAAGKPASFPRDFTISVSADGSTWTQVAQVTDAEIPALSVPLTVTFDEVSARYVKINFTKSYDMAVDDTLDRVQLAEIGIYNTHVAETYTLEISGNGTILVDGETVSLPFSKTYDADTDVTVEAVSDTTRSFESWSGSVSGTTAKQTVRMNSNKSMVATFVTPDEVNLALKKKVSASSNLESGSTWGAQLLTDGIISGTGYSSNDTSMVKEGSNACSITIDIDLTEAKLLDTIILHPRNTPKETAAGQTPSYPRDFTFQVSNDGKNWTVVKAVTDERTPDAGEAMTYTLDTPVVGRYVRLHVTKAGLVEDSDLYYRVQLSEEQIFNRSYTRAVSFTNAAQLDAGTTLQSVLTADLVGDKTLDLNGTGLKITYTSSDETVATVDETGCITGVAAGEAEITATVTINGYTFQAAQTVQVNKVETAVELLISGEDTVTLDQETVSFTVSAKNTNGLTTAIVTLKLDSEIMEAPEVTMLNGWETLGEIYKDGTLKVAMVYTAGTVTDKEATPMMEITARLTGKRGTASTSITEATLSGFAGDDDVYMEAILGDGASTATTVSYNKYDVNHDDIVDQLDLTRLQRAFGARKGESGYRADYDFDGDGEITIAEMILIVLNYTEKEF